MRLSEKKLQEQESVIRPNRYVALALTVLSFFIIGMLLVNEANLFLVNKERMRFGAFAALIVLEMSLFATGTDTGLRSEKTKYLMIAGAELASAILCIVLTFHATLILVLPMLLAAQYPSRRLSHIALACSMFVAFISPLVSYFLGLWDTAFLTSLTRIGGYSVIQSAGADTIRGQLAITKILFFQSTPHALILLAFSPLSFAIAKSGEERLNSEIQVLHMSQSDSLTGVFNRLTFDQLVAENVPVENKSVGVVYVDANNLHKLNNEQGHIAGDRLLICVADSLKETFDNESVYRVGGDEFVCILYGLSLYQVQERIAQARAKVELHGYSIAYGIEYAQPPCTLPALITSAEAKMQIDKKRYHLER